MEGLGAIVPTILWPKDFPELKLIDDALRCNICYDYIKTCMVTPCAHSYCSKCIRTSLLYKTACPSCFEETFENSLRNNRVLDRVVELFVSVKDKLLKHLKIAAVHFNCNDHLKSSLPSQYPIDQKSSIPDATPKSKNQKLKSSSTKGKLNFTPTSSSCVDNNKSNISKCLEDILGTSTNKSAQVDDLECLDLPVKDNEFPKIPPMFLQPKVEPVSKVEVPAYACPVCGVNIPERNMNTHLDTCLANVDKPPVKSPVKTKQMRSPLKKMVWSLMSEKDLRKKLKDYGLNTQGDKKALISRLQRYVLLYNSECDSENPRPISEIIRLTEKEEKQIPMQNQQQRLIIGKKTDPKVIEEENKKYINENKNSFKKLIDAMKRNDGKNIKPLSRLSNRISSDDENDLQEDKKAESSTTSKVVQSISLSDSEDDFSPSPILGEARKVDSSKKHLVPECSSDSHFVSDYLSKSDKYSPKVNKVPKKKQNDFLSVRKTHSNESSSDSSSHSSQHGSPERLPSPSCIITEHSRSDDSNDSLSLLIDRNMEDDVDNITEAETENIPNNVISQAVDPDYFIDAEDLFESNSDEVFQQRRKSKRKHSSLVPVVPNSDVTPRRRTKRRLN